jgi:glycosyltransferase involved in cell wall biosynthesis
VVHVIDNLGSGGKERQCVELLKGLSRLDDQENLLIILSAGLFYRDVLSLPHVRVDHAVRRFRTDARIVARVYRLCKAFRPDVVAAYDSMSAVCIVPTVRLLGARFVNAMVQDAPPRLSWKLRFRRRLTFPPADRIVSNSRAGLSAYRVPPVKGCVIHNGYELARLEGLRDPRDVRERLQLGEGLIVGMVANFSRFKDHRTFLEAARELAPAWPEVVFALVGDGETLEAHRRALAPATRDRVRFLGSQTDVESIVNVLDVGVLSTFTEGISNAIMEYMALGKPVVATRGGGTAELVSDGETGFLVAEGDARGMAEQIAGLLEDGALRRRMGAAGRDRLAREFTMTGLVTGHRNLYDEMVGSC